MQSQKYTRTKPLKQHSIPSHSIIAEGFGPIHYVDSFSVPVEEKLSVDSCLSIVFGQGPNWVEWLMRFRNTLAGWVGLKKAPTPISTPSTYYSIGQKAFIFTVSARHESEIVMSESDKHLQFRTSVLVTTLHSQKRVYVTTLVQFKNRWGRLYFFFVKPFHQIIVSKSVEKVRAPQKNGGLAESIPTPFTT